MWEKLTTVVLEDTTVNKVDAWLTLVICEKGALAWSLNGASTKPNKKESLYLSF